MSYEFISAAHITAAVISLVTGAVVVLWQKGTYRHKVIGYCYVAAMLTLNITALLIYRLTGSFGPFHVMALISLGGLLAGFAPALLRRPDWLKQHLNGMAWSYIGLLMAAASELAVRLPNAPFWPGVFVGSGLFYITGWYVLVRNRPRLLSRHGSVGAQPGAPADGPASLREAGRG